MDNTSTDNHRPKGRRAWALTMLCLVVVATSCKERCTKSEEQQLRAETVSAISGRLEQGDIVLRRGNSLSSNMVSLADKRGTYSHGGMVVLVDKHLMVVHAVPGEQNETEGVERLKCDSVERFFAPDRCRAGAVLRYRHQPSSPEQPTSHEVAERAADRAMEYYKQRVLFDNGYNMADSTTLYCTELIYRAYLWQGVDITGGRRGHMPGRTDMEIIYPSNLLDNPDLELITTF